MLYVIYSMYIILCYMMSYYVSFYHMTLDCIILHDVTYKDNGCKHKSTCIV